MSKLLERNKKYLKFIVIIILIGILVGVIYYLLLNKSVKSNIILTLSKYTKFSYNAIIKDLVIMSLLLISSFFLIGIPLSIFYLFYESLSIGFILTIFYNAYSFKGLLFITLYILVNKTLTLLLMIIFIKKLINIGRNIIGAFIYRKNYNLRSKIIANFRNSLYIVVFILIINIILYFISPHLFNINIIN